MYNATCEGDLLSFSTNNVFKQMNEYTGSYTVLETTSGTQLAAKHFDFRAHWRATDIAVELGADHASELEVWVTNQWGQTGSVSFTC